MALGLAAGLVLHGFIKYGSHYNISVDFGGDKAVAATPQPIPTKLLNGAPTPDWSNITFKNLKFSTSGSVQLPNIQNPGMKPTRTWMAGQSLSEVLELGDFQDTELQIEQLSLQDLATINGDLLTNYKLDSFGIISWQTIPNLVTANPKLGEQLVSDVPPINDAITKIQGIAFTGTVNEAIATLPELNDAQLGNYIKLSDYDLLSIPGIETVPIENFYNWQNATINEVPDLASVPMDQFPSAIVPDLSFVGKVDLPLREIESDRTKSISGSYQDGFNVACSNNCAHIEIAGDDTIVGAQWMSGKFQEVNGGFGILGALNGGKEGTGRHPFGKAFKQEIQDIDEASGNITSAIFFRICKRGGFIDLGCSPYFIGPVPFFSYHEMDPIILGAPLNVPKN